MADCGGYWWWERAMGCRSESFRYTPATALGNRRIGIPPPFLSMTTGKRHILRSGLAV